jgi:hypothetical protein
MRAGCLAIAAVAVVLLAGGSALAQFGHPLKGTWSGDWGSAKDKQTHVVLEFNWDGKAITGNINPGPKAVSFQKAELDPSTWKVHVEAQGKDAAGAPLRYVIDGKMENIGAYQRVLSGTWIQGSEKSTFRVVRN